MLQDSEDYNKKEEKMGCVKCVVFVSKKLTIKQINSTQNVVFVEKGKIILIKKEGKR